MNRYKLLLEDRYAPLTFTIGFLRAPLSKVREGLEQWNKELGKQVKYSSDALCLKDALHRLEPLTTLRTRQLIISTKSNWTAYFENRIVGADAVSVIGHLANELKCKGAAVTCIPNTLMESKGVSKGTYGATSFELFSETPTEFLNYERSIASINDGGKWQFVSAGNVQSYEHVERYKTRSIKERFTCDHLEEYCQAIGIDVFNEEYYCPEEVFLTYEIPASDNYEQISLTDARVRLGLPLTKK